MRRCTHLRTVSGFSLGPGFQVEWSGESISVIESSVSLSSSTYTAALLIPLDAIRVDKIIAQILIDLSRIAVAHYVDDLGCFVAWVGHNFALPALSHW